MKVTFHLDARDDLDRVFAWIAKDNPRAAYAMVARIEAKVMQLAAPELAHMGRPGLVEGTRELIEWPSSSSIGYTKTAMKSLSRPLSTARKTVRPMNRIDQTREV